MRLQLFVLCAAAACTTGGGDRAVKGRTGRPEAERGPRRGLLGSAAGGLPVVAARSECPAPVADPVPLAVVHLASGDIGDAFALSPDGRTLYYVANESERQPVLRAVGLRSKPQGERGLDLVPLLETEAQDTRAILPLPGDRVLAVGGKRGRGERYDRKGYGRVYGLGARRPLARLGPANEFALTDVRGRPAIVAHSHSDCVVTLNSCPEDRTCCPVLKGDELRFQAFDAADYRRLGSRVYPFQSRQPDFLHACQHQGDDPRSEEILTALGSAGPLYLSDDLQTLVVVREEHAPEGSAPSVLGVIDTLSGRLLKKLPLEDHYLVTRSSFNNGVLSVPSTRVDVGRHWSEDGSQPKEIPPTLMLQTLGRVQEVRRQADLVRRILVRLPAALSSYPPLEPYLQRVAPRAPGGRERWLMSVMLLDPARPYHEMVIRRHVLLELDPRTGLTRHVFDLPSHGGAWFVSASGRLAVLRVIYNGPSDVCQGVTLELDAKGRLKDPPPPPPPPHARDTQLEIYDIGL